MRLWIRSRGKSPSGVEVELGMRRFKVCHRCEGNVLLEKDQYGWYEQCLQCGYLRDLQKLVAANRQPRSERKTEELAWTARVKAREERAND